MKRGDVVIATGPGFGKKPRPFVVAQADDYASLPTLILLPISSELADPPSRLRVPLKPDEANGLRKYCEVSVDLPVTVRIDKVHQHIGNLGTEDMLQVKQALGLVLGFAE